MKQMMVLLFMLLLLTNYSPGSELSGQVKVQHFSENKWMDAPNNANVVVFLLGIEEPPDSHDRYLDQKDKAFSTPVLAISKGQRVFFRNMDPVNHNIFSLSKAKKFDLGLYKDPVVKSVTFDQPGIVKVFCNIHHQMNADILVLKNNKYAVTGVDGTYRIGKIPAGKYKARVWAQGSKILSQSLTLAEDSKEILNFKVKVRQRSLKHLNKFGKPYKEY
ncbi:MAG: hypothetical protein HQM14_09980 [SAR324 cluster bacterium]|nr:hypothetical protein [SAR324 cluster bacterium]